MDNHAEHDGAGLPNQPTHTRFDWHTGSQEPCIWYDERYKLANETVVQVEGWAVRFYTDESNKLVVSRV